MGKRSRVTDWYKDEPAHHAWVYNYLVRRLKDYEARKIQAGYAPGVHALEALALTLEGEKFVRVMRNSWRRIENNKARARSTFSYTMPRTADRALSRLARQFDKTKSATLEALIQRGFDFEQGEQKVRRDALAKEREAWQKRNPSRVGPTLQEQRLAARVNMLELEIAKRQELLSSLLVLYAQREVLLGGLPAIQRGLTQAQRQKVVELHETLLAHHAQKLGISLKFNDVTSALADMTDTPVLEGESLAKDCVGVESVGTAADSSSTSSIDDKPPT